MPPYCISALQIIYRMVITPCRYAETGRCRGASYGEKGMVGMVEVRFSKFVSLHLLKYKGI